MKKTFMVAPATLMLALALAGCRDPGSEAKSDQGAQSADAGQVSTDQAASSPTVVDEAVSGLERPLPGGIETLSFPFHVSVDRDTGARRQGKAAREVGLEFLGPSMAEVEAAFTASVTEKGGSVSKRETKEEALRVVYALPDGTAMLAWFRPDAPKGEGYALQKTDATGTLYLAWPYVEKSLR